MCQPSAGSTALASAPPPALRDPQRCAAAAGKPGGTWGWLGLRQADSVPQQPVGVGDSWDASGKPKRATPVLTAAASPAVMPERWHPEPPDIHTQPC